MVQKRTLLLTGFKFVVSAAIITWVLYASDVEKALDQMLNMDIWWLLLAVVVTYVQIIVSALRWFYVMRQMHLDLPILESIRLFYIGGFYNQIMPGSIGGDVYRVYGLHKYGISLSPSFNSVIIDRIVAFVGLGFVAVVSISLYVEHLESHGVMILGVVWATFLASLLATAVVLILDKFPFHISMFKIGAGMVRLANDTRHTFQSISSTIYMLMVSAAGHIIMSILIYILAIGMGLDFSLTACLMLFPAVLIAMAIPISIAGWGVREGVMVSLFALVGVETDATLAVSLMFGGIMVVTSLPAGILWVIGKRSSVNQVVGGANSR